MRNLFLLIYLMSLPAVASSEKKQKTPSSSPSCKISPIDLATVLLESADKLQEIKKTGMTGASAEPTCKKIENGVTEFRFEFGVGGQHVTQPGKPEQASLIVTQDIRPSYLDGAVIYKFNVTYKIRGQ